MITVKAAASKTRSYSSIRGVNFSEDHTLVGIEHSPYLVNMYKDYVKGGQAIETIAGFRRRFDFGVFYENDTVSSRKIWNFFPYSYLLNNETVNSLVVHVGNRLYRWNNYPTVETENANIELLTSNMADAQSVGFCQGGSLYVLDGNEYFVVTSSGASTVSGYVPTTRIGIIPDGNEQSAGEELEQRNMLNDSFRNTFVATSTATVYTLSEKNLTSVDRVEVYGQEVTSGFTVDLTEGTVTFETALQAPVAAGYDAGYAGVEITATKSTSNRAKITHCTLSAIYDNAIFVSGNPACGNVLFYSAFSNPTYFGVLNFVTDGIGENGITALVPYKDVLVVLKSGGDDSTVYYHSRTTVSDVIPVTYPHITGVTNVGCLGQAVSFLDDLVFVSPLGVDAIGTLSVGLERALEHRSRRIDGKLLQEDLHSVKLAEWNGYLLAYVNGNVYMADSRARVENELGEYEYEWFYLESIGVYQNQYTAYTYASELPTALLASNVSLAPTETQRTLANPPLDNGNTSKEVSTLTVNVEGVDETFNYVVDTVTALDETTSQVNRLVNAESYKIGGVFKPATIMKNLDGNIWFGTEIGVLVSFNFDLRVDGDLPSSAYEFDGRILPSAFATAFDNCGYPNCFKSTVGKSLVIKCKTISGSSLKVKARTNNTGWSYIGRINNGRFGFDDLCFDDLVFNTYDQQIFVVDERKKNWVEKQLLLYNDDFGKCFAFYYLTYEYRPLRRVK